MAGFLLRPKAISDLDSIWDYTVEVWGVEQAERYLRMINESFIELSKNPRLGRSCPAILTGYFKHRIGRHVIFFRTSGRNIDIVRILHQQMDFERHLY